jgi:hypothetical protein
MMNMGERTSAQAHSHGVRPKTQKKKEGGNMDRETRDRIVAIMDQELVDEAENDIKQQQKRIKAQRWDEIEPIMGGLRISRTMAVRLFAIEQYGGRCLLCKEDRIPVLDFHHVHGGGKDHVKSLGGALQFHYWLIENDFPPEVAVLCANCHRMTHHMEKTIGRSNKT